MENKNTAIAPKEAPKKAPYTNALKSVQDRILPALFEQCSSYNIQLDQYQKQCGESALSAINNLLLSSKLSFASPELDNTSLFDIVKRVVYCKLNANATPREVYFQLRNVNMGKDPNGRDVWKKVVESGIEGDGNEAIVRNFGRDVKKVHQFWAVREGDKFTYPKRNGINVEPPEWEETGVGKIIRVVYPIEKKDGTVDYIISERSDVYKNLVAHISNNMMNATFGICEDRYKATADQKKRIAEKKKELLSLCEGKSVDEIIDILELQDFISPSWGSLSARESMIIRKMRNNALKSIPKDWNNLAFESSYNEFMDDSYATAVAERQTMANALEAPAFSIPPENVKDAEYTDVQEHAAQAQHETDTEPESETDQTEKETEQEVSSELPPSFQVDESTGEVKLDGVTSGGMPSFAMQDEPKRGRPSTKK